MEVTILNIIILVVAIINGAFIAFSKEIASQYPKLGWINKLAFRIILAVLIIVIPYLSNQKKEEINKENNLREQKARDSLNQEKQLNYSLRVQNQLTNALAKYGLKYDSTKNEIARIVSSKSSPDPEITLSYDNGMILDSIANNTCYFRIVLSNRKAPSTDIKILTHFVTFENGKYYLIKNPYKNNFIFPSGESLSTDATFTFRVNIPFNNASIIYCYLGGSYKNVTRNKTYFVNSIYSFEIKEKRFGLPLNPAHEKVENILKEKGIM